MAGIYHCIYGTFVMANASNKDPSENHKGMPTESKTIIVIAIISGIIIVLLFFINKDISSLIASVVGIAVAVLVAILFYKIQKRDAETQQKTICSINETTKQVDKMIQRINYYREEQQQLQQSILRGPLSIITYELESIRKELSRLEDPNNNLGEIKKNLQNSVDSINTRSYSIINYIPGDVYFDIIDVTKTIMELKTKNISEIKNYLEKDKTILNKDKRLLKQIDSLIYSPLEEVKYQETFEDNFNNMAKGYTIVYGQQYDEIYDEEGNDDHTLAKELKEKLVSRAFNCCVVSDETLKKNKSDKRNDNLILIGGTSVNKITSEIIPYLPIQYVPAGRRGGLYSRLSLEIYPGPDIALLQVIPNRFAESGSNTVIIIAFGIRSLGTKAAVQLLRMLFCEIPEQPEEFAKQFNQLDQNLHKKVKQIGDLANKRNPKYIAKILTENEQNNRRYNLSDKD